MSPAAAVPAIFDQVNFRPCRAMPCKPLFLIELSIFAEPRRDSKNAFIMTRSVYRCDRPTRSKSRHKNGILMAANEQRKGQQ
jgi:hypothetical protein